MAGKGRLMFDVKQKEGIKGVWTVCRRGRKVDNEHKKRVTVERRCVRGGQGKVYRLM